MDYYVDTLVDKFGFNRIHADGCKHLPKGVSRLFFWGGLRIYLLLLILL